MVPGLLWLLLAALALLIGLVLAVILLPVRIRLNLCSSPKWRLKVAVRLLGGLTPPIPIHDSARRRSRRARAEERRKESGGKQAAAKPRLAGARGSRVLAEAPRLLAEMLRSIRLERLRVDADVGLSDPADTGQLYGLLTAATRARPPGSALAVELRPDFTGPRFSGELEALVDFRPAALVAPGIRLAWRVFGPV